MKNGFKFALLALAALLTVTAAQAAEKPFTMRIGENETLIITSPNGKQIATLPTATVGKKVQDGLRSFLVSYGKDANANLSVIITPDPDHPNDVTVTFNNREVSMDRSSVVTMTLTDGGRNVVVDPGYTGTVKVDGQVATTATNSNGTPVTTLVASNTGTGSPTGQVPGPTAQQTPDPNGTGNGGGLDSPMLTALAPQINPNFQAVFSTVTDPAETSPHAQGP